jgi:NADH-quinone oxidoreductase subunit K
MIPLEHFLTLAAILFVIGVIGVITRRNAIIMYMCIELMLNAANLTLIAFSKYNNNMDGHVFTFMVMAVAAAEAAVGLALIINLFRQRGSVSVKNINIMKG